MKVKTFYANSMQEAIRSIKQELGPEAVILSTRRVRKWGNAFGMLGNTALEVMAAIEEEELPSAEPPGKPPRSAFLDGRQAGKPPSFEENLHAVLQETPVPPARGADSVSPTSTEPRQDAGLLMRAASTKSNETSRGGSSEPSTSDLAGSLQSLYAELLTQGLRTDTAYRCLRELQETLRDPDRTAPQFLLQFLRGVLATHLRSAGPLLLPEDEQKIVLFVGPSGVGKTTTIAKLAAHYRLEEKRSVAMITVDNYRPAAVEQLRLYANVLGVELAIASSCGEARECAMHMDQVELIFVDTPGFNPRSGGAWDQWKALHDLPHRLEMHLVLAATTRIQDIEAAVRRLAAAPKLRLLFTKLDETTGYGSVFEAAHNTGIPLSYWGTGPRVPEDLAPASVDRLIELLLGASVPMTGASNPIDVGERSEARHLQYRVGRRDGSPSISITAAREQHHD